MADHSAVALSWFQAATDPTLPTEQQRARLQQVWQEREQLLQMRDLLQVQLVRLISSTTQSDEEVQNLMHERRLLLNELASSQSTDEVDTRAQHSQFEHLQMSDCQPISPGPEEVPWLRPCSQRSQHRSTNSLISTPQAAPTRVSWSAVGSTPGNYQQPGPVEIPWPQPWPQPMQSTQRNALQSEAAPIHTGSVLNSHSADLEQEHGEPHFSRPSPPGLLPRSMAQPAQASPTTEVPWFATNNSNSRRPMRNAPVALPQSPHPQFALTTNLQSGQAQAARNRQFQQTQAHQQLQAPPAQQPVTWHASSAPSASILNDGGTIGLIFPPLPTAAPAA